MINNLEQKLDSFRQTMRDLISAAPSQGELQILVCIFLYVVDGGGAASMHETYEDTRDRFFENGCDNDGDIMDIAAEKWWKFEEKRNG